MARLRNRPDDLERLALMAEAVDYLTVDAARDRLFGPDPERRKARAAFEQAMAALLTSEEAALVRDMVEGRHPPLPDTGTRSTALYERAFPVPDVVTLWARIAG